MSKDLLKISKKTNNTLRTWAKDLHKHQRSIQMAKKHMERCSTSLVIREKQIKTVIRYHYPALVVMV